MKNILVVDDSKSIRELVTLTLQSAGYNVSVGTDGSDAIKLLDSQEINLVITDLNMPRMDGITLIQEIRANSKYGTIPILMLTTESQANKKEEAKLAGATGWIVKPFAQEKLIEVVKKVLR